MIFVILFAIFVGLAVAVAVTVAWMQGAYYEQQTDGLFWRAPIVAAILTASLGLMGWLDQRWPNQFGSLFQFSVLKVQEIPEFWTERKSEDETLTKRFTKQISPLGRVEYVDEAGRRWQRSDSGVVTAILIEEEGVRKRFVAQLDPQGNFRRNPRDPNKTLDVEYIEESSPHRKMTESAIGTLTQFRGAALIVNFIVNFIYLLVWIAALALIMELQWPHAIWLGLAGWAVSLILVWPWLQSWMLSGR